ncbi:MAG: hypothetical protein FJY86_04020 [Candidatus Diapherotrites archaeon]|uniref:Uncharacterized protein n=1 Tax=Candidatus Iainarchaeum sp. TaxID=3101447 RepID=A0A8T4CBG1_9ARCH|nr:hypothetical protein [Candidatus Diapherotrites archaeon]
MSLTSFVKVPEVKRGILGYWPKPVFNLEAPMLAPPESKNYSLIGTAFDYLLWFYLKRKYSDASESEWVAEIAMAPEVLFSVSKKFAQRNGLKEREVEESAIAIGAIGIQIIDSVKKGRMHLMETGELTDGFLADILRLSKLDAIYRGGYFPKINDLIQVDPSDVKDLRKLYSIIPSNIFQGEKIALNPNFGDTSLLVGGADADAIIDGCLIDFKTTKFLDLKDEYWVQLVGYAVLSDINSDTNKAFRLNSFALYFSRHGVRWMHQLERFYSDTKYAEFKKWFIKQAKSHFNGSKP